MCYAPTRKCVGLIKRANERINEGKLPEAKRLLLAAKQQMGQVSSVEYDGKRVGVWYAEAVNALQKTQSSNLESEARVQRVIDAIRPKV